MSKPSWPHTPSKKGYGLDMVIPGKHCKNFNISVLFLEAGKWKLALYSSTLA